MKVSLNMKDIQELGSQEALFLGYLKSKIEEGKEVDQLFGLRLNVLEMAEELGVTYHYIKKWIDKLVEKKKIKYNKIGFPLKGYLEIIEGDK